MPLPEVKAIWACTDTTATAWEPCANARDVRCYIETAAGSTGSWQILTAASTGGSVDVLSSGTLGASSCVSTHFSGPFGFMRPRVKTITSTGTITVTLFGN